MNENKGEQRSIKKKVLEKIRSGEVNMRPKIYFLLKAIFVAGTILVFIGFFILLTTFIVFHLRAGGVLYLPGFGFRGMGLYFTSLPWILILLSVFLIFILEILTKRFSFVWRQPALYSLLAIILITIIGGFFVDRVAFHQSMLLRSEQGRFFLVSPIYREFGMPKFRNIHRGVIKEIDEESLLLQMIDGEVLKAVFLPDVRYPLSEGLEEGDTIVVVGERDNGTIQAFGVRKIDDDFRQFERRPRPPMNRMR